MNNISTTTISRGCSSKQAGLDGLTEAILAIKSLVLMLKFQKLLPLAREGTSPSRTHPLWPACWPYTATLWTTLATLTLVTTQHDMCPGIHNF